VPRRHHRDEFASDAGGDPDDNSRAAVNQQAGGGTANHKPAYRRFASHAADLPRWRLDLGEDPVEFDSRNLTVTDQRTGESCCLRGWKSFGISGVVIGDRSHRALAGTPDVWVRAEQPPTIGRWHQMGTP
jgi:hypothetical protein